jgi:pyruvate,water dikinase
MVLYYVNAQVGEDLVTNPEDESVPEELLLSPRNPKRDRVVQRSNRTANDAPVLGERHRQELRDALRVLHDRFAELYDRQGDAEFGMEVEFKVTKDDVLLIKQARPWIG